MSLKQNLESDLLIAMRSSDLLKKNVIRLVLSSIKLMEVEKQQALDDSAVITIIQKELKQRFETIAEARKISRNDVISQNLAEIEVLETYLPRQMSETELEKIIKIKIAELNAKDIKDMGRVMKEIIPSVAGQASNDLISKVVRSLLNK